MKLKHVPNMLGILRVALMIPLIVLFVIDPFSVAAISVFIAAGLTDMIDGPIARRIKGAQSQFGATLDAVADMLMVVVAFIVIVPAMDIYLWIMITFYSALGYKLLSGLVGQIKHKQTVFLHTYGNKFLALILFALPIMYFAVEAVPTWLNVYMIFVFVAVFIITTEEIIINLRLRKPALDIKSMFGVNKANAEFEAQQAKVTTQEQQSE